MTQLTIPGEDWEPIDHEPRSRTAGCPAPTSGATRRRGRPSRSSRDARRRRRRVVAERTPATALTVSHAGHVYAVDEISHTLFFVPKGGVAKQIDDTLARPARRGALTPIRRQLYVADAGRQLSYAYRIQADGTPVDKQPYIYVHHMPGAAHDIGSAGMTVDTEGRIYMATTLGIQVFDQLGKCHGILRAAGRRPRHHGHVRRPGVQPPDRGARRQDLHAQDQGDRRAVVDGAGHAAAPPRL